MQNYKLTNLFKFYKKDGSPISEGVAEDYLHFHGVTLLENGWVKLSKSFKVGNTHSIFNGFKGNIINVF